MSLKKNFHHRGEADIPHWASPLYYPYWKIRVEGRDKAKRRKYYRQVHKIKLELAEAGHDIELINAVCRYLANFRETSAKRVNQKLAEPERQMRLF